MPRAHLTPTFLRGLDENRPSKLVEWWDEQVRGLCARVHPTRITWAYRYRFGGRHRRLTIGTYHPRLLNVSEARVAAMGARHKVEQGLDPAIELEARRTAPTVEEIWRHYLETHQHLATVDQAEGDLERHVGPAFGRRQARSVTRGEWRRWLRGVAKETPALANRIHAQTRSVYQTALLDELVEENPLAGVPMPAEAVKRKRVLGDGEIRALWAWCEESQGRGARALQLLLLTGQRAAVVLGCPWKEIDGEWWEIPAERMKRREGHRIYLSTQARAILEECRGHRKWILPGLRSSKPMSNLSGTMLGVRRDLDLPHWVPHDLRRTCATKLRELGVARDVVSAVLHHAEAGTTGQHYLNPSAYDRELSAALQAWGDRVEAIAADGGVMRFPSGA